MRIFRKSFLSSAALGFAPLPSFRVLLNASTCWLVRAWSCALSDKEMSMFPSSVLLYEKIHEKVAHAEAFLHRNVSLEALRRHPAHFFRRLLHLSPVVGVLSAHGDLQGGGLESS